MYMESDKLFGDKDKLGARSPPLTRPISRPAAGDHMEKMMYTESDKLFGDKDMSK